jgi:calcineurin-like phosphoesterase family protein
MRRVSCISLVLALVLLFAPTRAADRRIVAVADVHGAVGAFVSVLQGAGIVDGRRRWAGGSAVLVQTGDLTDRGAGVREALDLVMALERQARAAGGRVEALLGNHELMNFVGSTRYVTPEIAAAWADGKSESRRERGFEQAQELAAVPLDKAEWLAAHPPGFIECREAFRPEGRYGRWLRSRRAVVQIDGTIFMHAGIDPANMLPLDTINRGVRDDVKAWDDGVRWLEARRMALPFSTMAEVIAAAQAELARIEERRDQKTSKPDDQRTARVLTRVATIRESSLFAAGGPMWFRGYSTWTDEEGAAPTASLLKQYGARRFVTGHTVQAEGRIRSRFNGGIFLIDTGMLSGRLYPGGRASALEIVGDRVTPLYGAESTVQGR